MNAKLIARRLAYGGSLLAVAGTAAYASYFHMRDVALLGHQRPELATAMPFSVDGMMLVAAMAIAEDKAQGRKPRAWARLAMAVGALVSVAANITATAYHFADPLSIAVSSWPPVALFITIEVMSRKGKLLPTLPVKPVAVSQPPAAVVAQPAVAVSVPSAFEQAQQAVRREWQRQPAPVSPAPMFTDRRMPGTGPVARRVAKSPLTGKVLMEAAPKV